MNEQRKPSAEDQPTSTQPPVSDDQTADQDELYTRYLEQQRRLSCPGCGEGQQYY